MLLPNKPEKTGSWSLQINIRMAIATPQQYEKDKVGKYVPYFKGTEILAIPGLMAEFEQKSLSYIITD